MPRRYRRVRRKNKTSATQAEFEALRQFYALPIDIAARTALLKYLGQHTYLHSFLVAAAEEIQTQFAQCHNDPVLKLDLLNSTRVTVTIAAEVMSAEADVRLNALRDWIDDAITTMGSVYFDVD